MSGELLAGEQGLYASALQLEAVHGLLQEHDSACVAMRHERGGAVRVTIWSGSDEPVCRSTVFVDGRVRDDLMFEAA